MPQTHSMPQQHDASGHAPIVSSLNLLDSLVAFYDQERMWVNQARAVLEEELFRGQSTHYFRDARRGYEPQSPKREADNNIRVKQEDESSMLPVEGETRRGSIQTESSGEQDESVRILEMFSEMMESRMQSCHRVNKLVMNASRRDKTVAAPVYS